MTLENLSGLDEYIPLSDRPPEERERREKENARILEESKNVSSEEKQRNAEAQRLRNLAQVYVMQEIMKMSDNDSVDVMNEKSAKFYTTYRPRFNVYFDDPEVQTLYPLGPEKVAEAIIEKIQHEIN